MTALGVKLQCLTKGVETTLSLSYQSQRLKKIDCLRNQFSTDITKTISVHVHSPDLEATELD